MGDRESDHGVVQEDGDVLETVSILSGQMLPHAVVTGRVPTVKTKKNEKGDVSGDARSESAMRNEGNYGNCNERKRNVTVKALGLYQSCHLFKSEKTRFLT